MTDQSIKLSEPMPEIMSLEEVELKLKEAAQLLTHRGEVGADTALKTMLDGELKIWEFSWRWKLQNLCDRAARGLGEDNRAIVLVREVLWKIPLTISLDESPDDPEDI